MLSDVVKWLVPDCRPSFLCGKNMKRKIVLLTAAVMAIISCGIHEIGGDGKENIVGGIWGGPVGGGQSGSGGLHTICYMTALDYRKDYDWRSDQARESVKCSLVVFADGTPVMKVPVGAAYETGSDPDMHRIIGGNLYTDYSTGSETVIKKNGVQMFRYHGPESLCGMEVIGEDVYTLGHFRDGSGFTFRKNGEIVLKRDEADVIGSLVNDGDSLCFAFCEHIRTSDGVIGRYYSSVNGKVSQIAVREDIKSVWDVLVTKDRTIYLASLTGVPLPVVFDGDSMQSLQMPLGCSLKSCRLFLVGNGVGAEGLCRHGNGMWFSVIWIDGMIRASFPSEAISSLTTDGDGVCCAMNPSRSGKSGKIYRSGELTDMPEGYSVIGAGSIRVIDGILHVGLSSLNGRKPVVWKDGQIDSLNVNGFISSIWTESVNGSVFP